MDVLSKKKNVIFFPELEVMLAVAESNYSFLSALQTSQVHP